MAENVCRKGVIADYWWSGHLEESAIEDQLNNLEQSFFVVALDGRWTLQKTGKVSNDMMENSCRCLGLLPQMTPEHLGDSAFKNAHGTRYAYMAGAMANGIASVNLVVALGKAGFLGSFGSGGLRFEQIEEAIISIKSELPNGPFAVNLLHQIGRQEIEFALVDLFLKHSVGTIEASAFLNVTPSLVYYRLKGLKKDNKGIAIPQNKIIAKISRQEVALQYMQPPDKKIIAALLEKELITKEEAELSQLIPVAHDITVEADSGGHTDNRPLISLLPGIISIRDEIHARFHYNEKIRIGAGGGIGTPVSALAALNMGAAYIVTGSINQACRESGTSDYVRNVLRQAEMADVMMAPCADMFELGAKVQVLKRGSFFPLNAQKLYELYRSYSSIEELPLEEREHLEKKIFKIPIADVWNEVIVYFSKVDTQQIERAKKDPQYRMSLIFRWYLGNSSRWAITGDPSRTMDMQIWCGQSMGAFNTWVKGTPFEDYQKRKVADIAEYIMRGAAYYYRINYLKNLGIFLPQGIEAFAERRVTPAGRGVNT
jgi:trans-AT polyketide synthase, acyltransferase and oxidoreductase domains